MKNKQYLSLQDFKIFVRNLNIKSRIEYVEYEKNNRPNNIPAQPESFYNDWVSWKDTIGDDYINLNHKKYLSFEEAKKIIHPLKINGQKQWIEYCKSSKKSKNIPADPIKVYKSEWKGYGDWLGTNRMSNYEKGNRFLPFEESKIFIQKLGVKSSSEWHKYRKEHNIENIPHSPDVVYKNKGWKSWMDWLGIEIDEKNVHTKKCTSCKKEKDFSKFNKQKNGKYGLHAKCKDCFNQQQVEYYQKNKEKTVQKRKEYRKKNIDKFKLIDKKYYKKNKEIIIQKNKKYYKNNKEKISIRNKKYFKKNADKISKKRKKYYNKEIIKQKNKKYREKNREYFNHYQKEYRQKNQEKVTESIRNSNKKRRHNDIVYKLKCSIRTKIRSAFKRQGFKKSKRTEEILGCTTDFFVNHILTHPNKKTWMTLENYGKYDGRIGTGWDIDHIKALINAITERDVITLNHYTNLQPLDSYINRYIKGERNDFTQDEIDNLYKQAGLC